MTVKDKMVRKGKGKTSNQRYSCWGSSSVVSMGRMMTGNELGTPRTGTHITTDGDTRVF